MKSDKIIPNNTEVLIYNKKPTIENFDKFTKGIVIDYSIDYEELVSYFHRETIESIIYTVLDENNNIHKCSNDRLLTKQEYHYWINKTIENNIKKIELIERENEEIRKKLNLVELDKPKNIKKVKRF